MTKQKLAKLPDVQTVFLTHVSGFDVRGEINGEWGDVANCVTKTATSRFILVEIGDNFVSVEDDNVANFYLHPKHNEELKPREGDLIHLIEHSGESVNDYLEIYKPIIFNGKKQGVFCLEANSETKFIELRELREFYYIVERPSVPYFPPFEWVEV